MSVLIKDINVPKCCAECRFAEEESLEWFTCYVQDCSLPNANRYVVDSNCPLIELPEDHGRLINADALKTWFGEKDLYSYDYIIGIINDEPTVIEAE